MKGSSVCKCGGYFLSDSFLRLIIGFTPQPKVRLLYVAVGRWRYVFSNPQSGKQNELYCAYQTGKHYHFASFTFNYFFPKLDTQASFLLRLTTIAQYKRILSQAPIKIFLNFIINISECLLVFLAREAFRMQNT